MKAEEAYIPIDCNFYDRLEAWSVLKEEVTIQLRGQEEPIVGLITDLYIRDKVEFLKLNTGVEVRLDSIASVNGIELTGACEL